MTNFWARLISGIALVAAALAVIVCGGYVLAGVLFAISLVGYHELMRACKLTAEGKTISSLEAVGFVAVAGYYAVMVWSGDGMLLLLALVLALVALMFVFVFGYPKYHARQIMEAFFCLVYAPVMLSCIYLTRQLNYGSYIVWLIFISSWICDTCAYCVGMLIGKHKMVPRLSPKKSIEGAVGGIVGAVIVGALYGYFLQNRLAGGQELAVVFALIGGAGSVIAQVGDLAASAIKRNHDIKDYGKLIPGHGGIMDRFDSVIFTAPMIYLLAVLLIRL